MAKKVKDTAPNNFSKFSYLGLKCGADYGLIPFESQLQAFRNFNITNTTYFFNEDDGSRGTISFATMVDGTMYIEIIIENRNQCSLYELHMPCKKITDGTPDQIMYTNDDEWAEGYTSTDGNTSAYFKQGKDSADSYIYIEVLTQIKTTT